MRNGPYILVVAPPEYPGFKYRGRYIYEHHLVWWQNTGEVVEKGEVIHHKNEVKTDNRFDNLERKPKGVHTSDHHTPVTMETVACGYCGGSFELPASVKRTRLKQTKSGKLYCSRSHGMKDKWNSQ